MKCPMCEKGNLKTKTVSYKVYGIELGKFPAKVCDHCKEEWFDEKISKKIEALEKKKSLFNSKLHNKRSLGQCF